jgi:CotH protein
MIQPLYTAIRLRSLVVLGVAVAFIASAEVGLCKEGGRPGGGANWPGQELFTNGAVSAIQIEIAPQDLQKLRKDSREFVRAEVAEGAMRYQEVAVHLKGSVGSFRPLDDKPGFTLDFARFRPAQRFHGLRRIHLNNSVEDPSYCNEQLGSELFRSAGIPAPRVSRTIVTLNERKLGLYVLKEGFTEDFLSCYFKEIGGNLYEPGEGHDVNQRLKKTSIHAPSQDRKALKALAEAALEPEPEQRWNKLENVLEVGQFIRFIALEVMLCHRDGYCLARNNFRVYQDLDTGRMVFFPHGMDQLFGSADLPWTPHMAGLVAKGVMETPQGKQCYNREFRLLFETRFKPELLTNRVDELVEPLRSALNASEFRALKAQALLVKDRIVERRHQLEWQLSQSQLPFLEFTNGVRPLTGWIKSDVPPSGQMDQATGPNGLACLHIRISSEANLSWRAKAQLRAGHYRFEGKVRVSGAKPLGFGAHQGAGLRIGGRTRQCEDLTGDSEWRLLAESFEVDPAGAEVEFICEFRASRGEAWFDCASLRVVKEP